MTKLPNLYNYQLCHEISKSLQGKNCHTLSASVEELPVISDIGVGVSFGQKPFQIVNHDESIVVSFQKPMGAVHVLIVEHLNCATCFGP